MALVCGALEGYTDPKAAAEKQDHYKRIQKLVTTFKDENGSYICRERFIGDQFGYNSGSGGENGELL